jgi:hypothetical protein
MVTIEQFGKAESTEVTEFQAGAEDCDVLAKILRKTGGVLDIPTYITGIDNAIALIDSIFILKAKLEADKVILQNA